MATTSPENEYQVTHHSFNTKEEAEAFVDAIIPDRSQWIDLLGPKPEWMSDQEWNDMWEYM